MNQRIIFEVIFDNEDDFLFLADAILDGDDIGKVLAEDLQQAIEMIYGIMSPAGDISVIPIVEAKEESIQVLAERTGIGYNTLIKAVREKRVDGRKSGRIWLSTEVAVKNARRDGRLRPFSG